MEILQRMVNVPGKVCWRRNFLKASIAKSTVMVGHLSVERSISNKHSPHALRDRVEDKIVARDIRIFLRSLMSHENEI